MAVLLTDMPRNLYVVTKCLGVQLGYVVLLGILIMVVL